MTIRGIGLAFAALVLCATGAAAHDKSRANLMVVLREVEGANKPDEALAPVGKVSMKLADGSERQLEPAWFSYLGDMQVRFVFDGPGTMEGASLQDLKQLGVTPDAALELGIANIRRAYGEPKAKPSKDLMQVQGKSPDVDSSYFLDRPFWRALLARHPEGIAAVVPSRGGLFYAPMADAKAVEGMKREVTTLHKNGGRRHLSSAVYLFKDDRWSVLQPPAKR